MEVKQIIRFYRDAKRTNDIISVIIQADKYLNIKSSNFYYSKYTKRELIDIATEKIIEIMRIKNV
jgi:hypothetical protein